MPHTGTCLVRSSIPASVSQSVPLHQKPCDQFLRLEPAFDANSRHFMETAADLSPSLLLSSESTMDMKRIFEQDDREFAGCPIESRQLEVPLPVQHKQKKRRRRKKKPQSNLVTQTLGQWSGLMILSDETLREIHEKHESLTALQKYHLMLLILYKWNERCPLPYVTVVLDPSDYEETVKNVFFMSILIRNGYVKIEAVDAIDVVIPTDESDERKELHVKAMEVAAEVQNFTLAMDHELWLDLITNYGWT